MFVRLDREGSVEVQPFLVGRCLREGQDRDAENNHESASHDTYLLRRTVIGARTRPRVRLLRAPVRPGALTWRQYSTWLSSRQGTKTSGCFPKNVIFWEPTILPLTRVSTNEDA